MATTIIPDSEMRKAAFENLEYANGYFATFKKSLTSEKSKFDDDLLYQMAIMSLEKYFVALLARYDWNASHHMPVALFNEAKDMDAELTPEMKQTCILVGKFEAICSLDGFGYRTPTKEDLLKMMTGIDEIKTLVDKRVDELNYLENRTA